MKIALSWEVGREARMSDDRDGRASDGWQRSPRSPSRGASGSRPRGSSLPVGSAAIGTKTVEPYRYTMADLEAQTGLQGRTIRYYIT